ncbi:hypothetical protein MNV49_002264 [Pseudohyphozyma bogoriensis]|nr:hypothetical protein MNV49_002264 [Pseudohyphozyma bogoriensis]
MATPFDPNGPPMAPDGHQLYWLPGMERPHEEEAPFVEEFTEYINKKLGLKLKTYWDLHSFSVTEQDKFWEQVWSYLGIIGERGAGAAYVPRPIDQPQEWFPQAKLNYAENVLLGHANARSNNLAVVSTTEPLGNATHPTLIGSLTWAQLYDEVRRAAQALRKLGVQPGDRVASFSASNAEVVVGFLAASTVGAVYCSCPAEFGPAAVIDRFSQFEPKVIFSIDSTRYNGKTIDTLTPLAKIIKELPKLTHVVLIGHTAADRKPTKQLSSLPRGVESISWQAFMALGADAPKEIAFWRGAFQHPLFVVFSSGTTGQPKAIIHGAGNILLARKLVGRIHLNLDHRDVCCQFTTLGWVMYNISLAFLTNGCTLVTYDGSPFRPTGVMFNLIETHKVSYFGTSPRYLQALDQAKYYPNERNDISSLKVLACTGAPVTPENYKFVANRIKRIYLFNGSGGTEIASSFISSVPTLPLYEGEIQSPTIGVAAESLSEDLKLLRDSAGFLVVTRAFPNMPLGFLNDPDRKRYRAAYFEDFKVPVWNQQDFVRVRGITGGYFMLGRSDGILNPGGVRFGSAELYGIVENFPEFFDESIAVGQRVDNADERVVLFLKMKNDQPLTPEIKSKLAQAIKSSLSVRHIPAVMTQVSEIPVTTNGKKVETYVKKLINGLPLAKLNTSALSNPDCLHEYINNKDVQLPVKAKL